MQHVYFIYGRIAKMFVS